MTTSHQFNLACTFIVLLILSSFSAKGQKSQIAQNRASLGMVQQDVYSFSVVEGQVSEDSTLLERELYNPAGLILETIDYRGDSVASRNTFEYLADTIMIFRNYYVGNDTAYTSRTEVFHDKNGKTTGAKDIIPTYKRKISAKNKYDSNGRLKYTKMKYGRRTIREEKHKYDDNGNKVEVISYVPTKVKKVLTYDRRNRHTHTHKISSKGVKTLVFYADFDDDRFVATRHTLNLGWTTKINGDMMKLTRDNVLTTERSWDTECRRTVEKKYLDGELISVIKYRYRCLNNPL